MGSVKKSYWFQSFKYLKLETNRLVITKKIYKIWLNSKFRILYLFFNKTPANVPKKSWLMVNNRNKILF